MSAETRWLTLIVASSLAAVAATFAATGNAVSWVPLLWFFAVIPGLAYLRLLRRDHGEPMAFWIAACGLSFAIDAVTAEALLYLHAFTPLTVVSVLAGIACLGAVIGRIRTSAREPDPVPSFPA